MRLTLAHTSAVGAGSPDHAVNQRQHGHMRERHISPLLKRQYIGGYTQCPHGKIMINTQYTQINYYDSDVQNCPMPSTSMNSLAPIPYNLTQVTFYFTKTLQQLKHLFLVLLKTHFLLKI